MHGIGRGDVEYTICTFPVSHPKNRDGRGQCRSAWLMLKFYGAMVRESGGPNQTSRMVPPADLPVACQMLQTEMAS